MTPVATLIPRTLDGILVRGEGHHIVSNSDRGNDNAQIQRRLLSQHGDAVEEIAALRGIDEGDQSIAYLYFEGVDVKVILDPFFGLFLLFLCGLLCGHSILTALRYEGNSSGSECHDEKGCRGKSRHKGESEEDDRSNHNRPGL